MAEIQVKNVQNEDVEKLKLADDVFNYEASPTLVWEAVRAFLAAQRKGTHATKTRTQVRGGGRKPWRQKGTGRARAGSTSSPIWKGGATTHGPRPRDYTQAFPAKKRQGAVKLVLTDKLRNGQLVVVDELELEDHRTRNFVELLGRLELTEKVLVVNEKQNRNLYLGSRNLKSVKTVPVQGVNVYDLLNAGHVLISKQAILQLQEALQR